MTSSASKKQIYKSCDPCRARKVKCQRTLADAGHQATCDNCAKRGVSCGFSSKRPSRRPNASLSLPVEDVPAQTGVDRSQKTACLPPAPRGVQEGNQVPECYVDQLLWTTQRHDPSEHMTPKFIKGNGIFGGNLSLTFFSDARLTSLSSRLGDNKLTDLVTRISSIVKGRITERPQKPHSLLSSTCTWDRPGPLTDRAVALKYIGNYFDRINAVFPLLDRDEFERAALEYGNQGDTSPSTSWKCLYHAVLALGCQFDGGGSFEPGVGKSWSLFSVSLSCLSDLLLQPDSLPLLQALTAMAIYTLGLSGLSVQHTITSEAVRRAQNLANSPVGGRAAQGYQRAFWVLYAIEKISSFHFGRSSIFVDSDILCPVPMLSETTIQGFDYFLAILQYSRLVSKAYSSLFCVGVINKPNQYFLDTVAQIQNDVEAWRLSLPDTGFRPGGSHGPQSIHGSLARLVTVSLHYFYQSLTLALCRANLHHLSKSNDHGSKVKRQEEERQAIWKSSRSILEILCLVEVEPFTNIWILASIPLTALFVLFDIIIRNPGTVETSSNLALLDMAAGHFSRIEYASSGALPGSLISEFSHIARDYVNRHSQIQRTVPVIVDQEQDNLSTNEIPTSPPPTWSFDNSIDPTSTQSHTITFQDDVFADQDWAMIDSFSGTDIMDIFSNFPL